MHSLYIKRTMNNSINLLKINFSLHQLQKLLECMCRAIFHFSIKREVVGLKVKKCQGGICQKKKKV